MNKVPHIDLKWVTPREIPVPEEIKQQLKLPDVVLQTLIRRGCKDESSMLRFIDSNHYIPTPSSELPDLTKGVQRVASAIRNGKKIGVWGDFDVDGQTATLTPG